MIGAQEAIPIVIVVLLLFGAKRIPELFGSLGQGIKEFKKSSREPLDDDGAAADGRDKRSEP